tara:strand:- start:15748 stop:15951 length:204 start_codon:yes stop_codon:yes gene_type:complete
MNRADYRIFSAFFDTKNISKCPEFKKFLRGELDLPPEEEIALSRIVERVITYFTIQAEKKYLTSAAK